MNKSNAVQKMNRSNIFSSIHNPRNYLYMFKLVSKSQREEVQGRKGTKKFHSRLFSWFPFAGSFPFKIHW